MPREKRLFHSLWQSVRAHFKHATLEMLFILLYVNLFQWVFGPQNSIVGVIFTILMAASLARDWTGAPVKHFFVQSGVLLTLVSCAYLGYTLPPLWALPVHLCAIFFLVYAYTNEHSSQMYFPYLLSYLFLVFLSPVPKEGLPLRMLGVVAGALGVIGYQLVKGRYRVRDGARDALTGILDEALHSVRCLAAGEGVPARPEAVRANLRRLSRMVYERRKRPLYISDASFAMIDAGRGLEHLVLLLYAWEGPITGERAGALQYMAQWLDGCRAFLQRERPTPPPLSREALLPAGDKAAEFFDALAFLKERLLRMTARQARAQYNKTALSFWVRVQAALQYSPVRLAYAARVALLLSLAAFAVQRLALPHGKWLLFTLASVSLPYAEDVGKKAKERLAATLAGGLAGAAAFTLFTSPAARTVVMMLSGYASFYCSSYRATFACATVGALGGAVFAGAFGIGGVGGMALIRLLYVGVGVGVALVANCALFPFTRKRATRQLWDKYARTTQLLTRICEKGGADAQLYYSLVIQTHLLEEQLDKNAGAQGWDGLAALLAQAQAQVREAHRKSARPLALSAVRA